ncbi:sugar kinase [Pseudooctadecabacter jejudonensis]|uniref:2-dehydro-3-deoxygluconokinase n=1 Tax=Pseudooctadecabacter jejudonensis TaxID=1391910 RepID=A0A1Y5TLG7_9RHOB|nr:sugar kinase [Pseudooctadecabacter jejudonensis]SLN63152.1 2-dehydro-3-deoxygluconokinase [Pseudooctadecabacter jejudonensis]
MRVLCIGECMAELAPSDVAGDFRLGFAGDTFNTAWYLARLAPQADVAYFSAVGDDAISNDMRTFIRAGDIDDTDVQTRAGRTVGLYMIALKDGERSFSYWRGQSAARTLADDPAALANAMDRADVIYFSGITLGILDPAGRDTLLEALANARANGKTIAFDPNLRPKLWANGEEMTAQIMRGAAVSDIALPSFEDEADWFGDADPQATANRYLGAGCPSVVVKNGAADVLYVDQGQWGTVTVAALDIVIDTTAAGDSFNAGVFAAIVTGQPLDKGIHTACTLSRQVIGHKGALVPVDAT